MPAKSKRKRAKAPALNARQEAFARAHFAGETRGIGSASARAAGYVGSDHSLETMASRLLRHVGVIAYTERLRREAEDATIADAHERRLMLSKMVRGTLQVPQGLHRGRVVLGPPKAADMRGAADDLAKANGEYREVVDVVHSGPNGGPIQVQHVPPAVARAELLAIYVAKFGIEEGERHVRALLGEPEPMGALEAPKEVP